MKICPPKGQVFASIKSNQADLVKAQSQLRAGGWGCRAQGPHCGAPQAWNLQREHTGAVQHLLSQAQRALPPLAPEDSDLRVHQAFRSPGVQPSQLQERLSFSAVHTHRSDMCLEVKHHCLSQSAGRRTLTPAALPGSQQETHQLLKGRTI